MPSLAARWRTWEAAGRQVFLGGGVPPGVTFPTTALKITVRIALGADLTASPLTWNWLDISERCRFRAGTSITVGRRDWAARVDSTRALLRIDNSDGAMSRRNPMGPYAGLLTRNTPIWVTVDPGSGEYDALKAFVNEWPVRWTDKSGVDSTVPIACAGVMRRLEKAPDLPAALDRSYLAAGPVAFWRLDDGDDAAWFASALPGGNRAVVERSPVSFASTAGPAGARGPVASLTGGGRIGMYPVGVSSTAWRVEWILNTEETQNGQPIEIRLPGVVTWIKVFVPWSGDPTLFAQGTDATNVINYFNVSHSFGSLENYENIWHHIALTAEQSGADITWKLYVNGTLAATDTTASQTLSTIKSIAANSMIFNESITGSVAYVAVFNDADAPTTADAMDGYAGEQAHERIARLCAEENIPCTITGGTSVELGPQPAGKLLNAVRDAADVDHGYLYEVDFGLGYICRSARLNSPVALALDFDERHIADEPEPADDDRASANRWTASRPDGSSATAEDADSIAADGLYEGGRDVNVYTDDQLIDEAGLQIGLGTVDEDRWPRLAINLRGTPELIPTWVTTRLGDHVTVSNPPSQVNPNPIDVVIEGWTETFDGISWDVVLNTSPGSPFEAFQLESTSGNRGRLGTRESTLGAELASGATTATITTTAGKRPWITTASFPAQFPFDIEIGGERITVNGVTSATSPQTADVTRTLAKTHAAGAQIRLWRPPHLALKGRPS